jgi:maltose-binding protein MalE
VGDFLPPAVASATLDGQLWGVPLSAQDMLLLLHNRALAAQPPATTDELIVMSRAFDDSENAGLVAAWDEAYWLLAWLNGFGGTLTTPDGRQPTLNTPQMVSALNLLRELYRAAPPDQQSYASGRDLFAAGQAALAIDGTWALPAYIGSDTLPDLGIAPLPRVPATGRRAAPPVSIAYLMLPHTLAGERLDRAQAFASYLVAPAAQERMAMTLQRLPTVREVLGIPAVTNDRVLSVAAIQAESAFGVPPTQAARCALLGINMQLEAVLEEDADQQEIAEAMQQDAKLCLEL